MYLKLQYVRLEVHTKHSQKQNDKLQKIYAITKAIFLYYINNILIAIKINKAAKKKTDSQMHEEDIICDWLEQNKEVDESISALMAK